VIRGGVTAKSRNSLPRAAIRRAKSMGPKVADGATPASSTPVPASFSDGVRGRAPGRRWQGSSGGRPPNGACSASEAAATSNPNPTTARPTTSAAERGDLVSERGRIERPGPQLRHSQLQITCWGTEGARACTVAPVGPRPAVLPRSGADRCGQLGLDQCLVHGFGGEGHGNGPVGRRSFPRRSPSRPDRCVGPVRATWHDPACRHGARLRPRRRCSLQALHALHTRPDRTILAVGSMLVQPYAPDPGVSPLGGIWRRGDFCVPAWCFGDRGPVPAESAADQRRP